MNFFDILREILKVNILILISRLETIIKMLIAVNSMLNL